MAGSGFFFWWLVCSVLAAVVPPLGLLAESMQHSTCVSHHRLTSVLFQLGG